MGEARLVVAWLATAIALVLAIVAWLAEMRALRVERRRWAEEEERRRAEEARRAEQHAASCDGRIGAALEGRLEELRAVDDVWMCQACGQTIGVACCVECGTILDLDERDEDQERVYCEGCARYVDRVVCECGAWNSLLREERADVWREGLLEVTPQDREYRIGLSWGGPADGFNVTVDEDGTIVEGEYYLEDWFDGARRSLPEWAIVDLADLLWLAEM